MLEQMGSRETMQHTLTDHMQQRGKHNSKSCTCLQFRPLLKQEVNTDSKRLGCLHVKAAGDLGMLLFQQIVRKLSDLRRGTRDEYFG